VSYPRWQYFPSYSQPPRWVGEFVGAVADSRTLLDSTVVAGLTSDDALRALSSRLQELGYQVETGKKASEKIRRPVLFGEDGIERVSYEIDAFHDDLGIAVEVEAGRGARGNAVYRDLIRTSLIVGARFLVLGVMNEYHHMSGGREVVVRSFDEARELLDAVFASGRLQLPFEGVLLFGY